MHYSIHVTYFIYYLRTTQSLKHEIKSILILKYILRTNANPSSITHLCSLSQTMKAELQAKSIRT